MAHESRIAGRQSQSPTPSLIDQRRGSAATLIDQRRGSAASSGRGAMSDQRKNSEASATIAKLSARTAAADARIRSLKEEIEALRRELDWRKRSDETSKISAKGDQQRVADLDLLLSYLNDMVHVTSDISSCCQGTSNISHVLWEDELIPPHSSASETKPQIHLFVAHLTHLLRIVRYLAQRAVQLESLVRGRTRGNTITRGQVLARVGQEVKDIEAMILGAAEERRRWEDVGGKVHDGGDYTWEEEESTNLPKGHFPYYDVEREEGDDDGVSDVDSDKTELMDDDMGPFATPVTPVSAGSRASMRLSRVVTSPDGDGTVSKRGRSTDGSEREDVSPTTDAKSISNVSDMGIQTENDPHTTDASDATLTNQLALANLLIHTKEDIITELETQLESSQVELDRLNQYNWELKLQNEHLKAMGEAKEKVVEELLKRLGELEDARSAAGMVKTVMTLIEATDVKEAKEGDGEATTMVVPNLAGMLGLRSVRSADRILLAPAAPPPCVPLPTVPCEAVVANCLDNGPTEPLPELPIVVGGDDGPRCDANAAANRSTAKGTLRSTDRNTSTASLRNTEQAKMGPSPSFIRASPTPSPSLPRTTPATRPRSTVRSRPATPVARPLKAPPTSPPLSPRPNPTPRTMTSAAGRARATSAAPNPTKVNRSRRAAGADAVATFPGRGTDNAGTFPRPGTVTNRSKVGGFGAGKGVGGVVGTTSTAGASVRSGIPTVARSARMLTPPASPLMNGGYGKR
ncbi:hypothetical protein HDV00_010267 [Rhizophlyctis rosea]|nr:hypothetical protein HDV00_010267 [Rhizophlyctis rosea]